MALAGRGFLAWYNARLTSHPYSVKAFGTGATYVASDCTAQAIEGEKDKTVQDRAARALKFGAVGCFWVGPLLTYWFNVMERFLPGRARRTSRATARRRPSRAKKWLSRTAPRAR